MFLEVVLGVKLIRSELANIRLPTLVYNLCDGFSRKPARKVQASKSGAYRSTVRQKCIEDNTRLALVRGEVAAARKYSRSRQRIALC